MDFSLLIDHYDTFLKGLLNTIWASLLGLLGSFVLGTVIAVFRITRSRTLRWFGTAYVEFLRNIPLLLVVFLFYLGLPSLGVTLSGFASGTMGLAVYTSAFIAEAIRAGIMAVPKGQTEAARSSGLTYVQAMLYVVLPQAIKLVIPPLGNQFINLVKNSSILSIVAGFDLMYYGDIIATETFDTINTYIFVALFYLLLTLPLSYGTRILERKLARHD